MIYVSIPMVLSMAITIMTLFLQYKECYSAKIAQ